MTNKGSLFGVARVTVKIHLSLESIGHKIHPRHLPVQLPFGHNGQWTIFFLKVLKSLINLIITGAPHINVSRTKHVSLYAPNGIPHAGQIEYDKHPRYYGDG